MTMLNSKGRRHLRDISKQEASNLDFEGTGESLRQKYARSMVQVEGAAEEKVLTPTPLRV